jgi:hypothetical protein
MRQLVLLEKAQKSAMGKKMQLVCLLNVRGVSLSCNPTSW